MRPVVFLGIAALSFGQVHHPSWWTWVSADASALVGLRLDVLRGTKAGAAIQAALFAKDRLALPELDCIKQSQRMVLSGPSIHAISWEGCTASQLREQAPGRGFRRVLYRDVELWVSAGYSLTHLGNRLTLIAARASLEAIIDESQSEDGRKYTPLLAQAAQVKDLNLWVVSQGKIPPLLSAFVQLEDAANRPEPLVTRVEPEPVRPVSRPVAVTVAGVTTPVASPVAEPPQKAQPKRVVRIVGLDEGTREIELPSQGH